MEISQLQEFLALSRSCNFQVTAEELSITQSALSKHIGKLEEELGVKLFERSSRGVTLNNYGINFLSYAVLICKTALEGQNMLSTMCGGCGRTLTIGVMTLHALYDPIISISDFSRSCPEVSLGVLEEDSEELLNLLRSGEVDVVFYDRDVSGEEFGAVRMTNDSLTAVLPVDHPLAGRKQIALSELQSETFLEHKTTVERREFLSACRKEGFEPERVYGSYYTATLLKRIKEGAGVCVMSAKCAGIYNDPKIVCVPIVPEVVFDTYVVYCRNREMPAEEKQFIEFMTGSSRSYEGETA